MQCARYSCYNSSAILSVKGDYFFIGKSMSADDKDNLTSQILHEFEIDFDTFVNMETFNDETLFDFKTRHEFITNFKQRNSSSANLLSSRLITMWSSCVHHYFLTHKVKPYDPMHQSDFLLFRASFIRLCKAGLIDPEHIRDNTLTTDELNVFINYVDKSEFICRILLMDMFRAIKEGVYSEAIYFKK